MIPGKKLFCFKELQVLPIYIHIVSFQIEIILCFKNHIKISFKITKLVLIIINHFYIFLLYQADILCCFKVLVRHIGEPDSSPTLALNLPWHQCHSAQLDSEGLLWSVCVCNERRIYNVHCLHALNLDLLLLIMQNRL